MTHRFVVGEVDVPELIFGIDFLSEHGVVLDLQRRCLQWSEGSEDPGWE